MGNKLKILSKENQDEVTRLNVSREISEAMIVTEKDKFICSTKTISCLKEDIKELDNKLKILSKENEDEVTRLNVSKELSETMIVTEKINSSV